ncbi:MAG: hypothetical protein K2Z80_12345 [Xanthobacteraceae bacterium]|nr:hypothetical protein [Xanthobacteraceae bacterium]
MNRMDAPPLRHVSRFRKVAADGPAIDGLELLFGPDLAPAAEQTQAAPPMAAPPQPQGAPVPELDGVELLFGPDAGSTEAQDLPDPNAEPDAPTWLGRRAQDIRGRKDPREANTPTVFDQFRGQLSYPTGRAAIAGASDAQMADIIQKQLGDRFIRREKDANNYDVFVTRGDDGSEQRGYVNAPGLDAQDISRGIYGAAPYAVGGAGVGALTKGLGWLGRTLAYGTAAGGTSIAGDVAQMPLGSEQGIEPMKAGIAALAGIAGVPAEAIASKAWARFVIEPKLFNRSTGTLTPEGQRLAASQGLDPAAMQADIAKTFAQTYSQTRNASQAALAAERGDFGIESTVGQRSKDPWQLTQEEAMRRTLYGEKARDTVQAFDARQTQAVDFAARTRMPSDFRTQATKQNGTMSPQGITHVQQMPETADLGASIQAGMKHARGNAEAAERQAWQDVTDILPRQEAFEILPETITGRLGGMRVTNDMPKASAMAKALDDYTEGKAFNEPVAKVLQQAPVKTVDEMRRQLLGMYKGATDPTDVAASKAIYEGFNDWIDAAAEKSLLAGAPEAAAKLRIARDTTKTMHGLFSPSVKGQKTPAARLISELEASDTPERAVQILFGPASSANPSTIKSGAVEALRSMKAALKKYADPRIAGDTIADLKIAQWARLVQNKHGNAHSPQNMLNNINAALANQRTLMHELYSPAEIGQIRRLAKQLETITYKPPNASGSGYTAAGLTKQFFGKLLDAIPAGRAVYEFSGVPKALGTAAARRAVNQTMAPAPRNALPYTSAVGATYGRR